MDLETFKKNLDFSLSSNQTLSFFCECAIEYSGRAEAFLEKGERLIVIKSDNTLIVHQDKGSAPVNYMKAGTQINYELENENLCLLQCSNLDLKEYLTIEIFDVYGFLSRRLIDTQALELAGTERDMSDMLKDNPELIEPGFKPLSREEHTAFGFIDVFGHDGQGNLIIVECKRYVAGLSAVQQLRRYVEKMAQVKGIDISKIRGILAAPQITKSGKEMLTSWNYEFVEIEPPKKNIRFKKMQSNLSDF